LPAARSLSPPLPPPLLPHLAQPPPPQVAQYRLAHDCGLSHLLHPIWVERTVAIVPGTGLPVSWDMLWMEEAAGLSLLALTSSGRLDLIEELLTKKVGARVAAGLWVALLGRGAGWGDLCAARASAAPGRPPAAAARGPGALCRRLGMGEPGSSAAPTLPGRPSLPPAQCPLLPPPPQLNTSQVIEAAVWDLLVAQCDRHIENVFIDMAVRRWPGLSSCLRSCPVRQPGGALAGQIGFTGGGGCMRCSAQLPVLPCRLRALAAPGQKAARGRLALTPPLTPPLPVAGQPAPDRPRQGSGQRAALRL
jgi:hypothetical protein